MFVLKFTLISASLFVWSIHASLAHFKTISILSQTRNVAFILPHILKYLHNFQKYFEWTKIISFPRNCAEGVVRPRQMWGVGVIVRVRKVTCLIRTASGYQDRVPTSLIRIDGVSNYRQHCHFHTSDTPPLTAPAPAPVLSHSFKFVPPLLIHVAWTTYWSKHFCTVQYTNKSLDPVFTSYLF